MPRFFFFLGSLLLLAACSDKEGAGTEPAGPPPRPVEVTRVEQRPMAETLRLVGSLAAAESTEIYTEIAGRIENIRFQEGDRVERGDLLFRLDDRELRAQLAEARAQRELARQDLARARELIAAGFISRAEMDRLRADFLQAEAETERLAARLDKTEIRAPFAGVVGARQVSPGAVIATDTVLTRVNDLSRLKIEFMVPERYLPQVSIGTVVRLPEQSRPDEPPPEGKVYFISSQLDRQSRASEVKALVEDPAPQLRPGMFANIELVLRTVEEALTVPEGAILSREDGHFLVAVQETGDEARAEFLPVDLGIRQRGVVQVIPRDGQPLAGRSVVAAGVGALPLFPGALLIPRDSGGKD